MLKTCALTLQVATFVVVGVLLVLDGYWRLGIAQLLLAVVQAVVYA